MNKHEYLQAVLKSQDLTTDERNELVAKRKEVADFLNKALGDVSKTIRWAGSVAKDTMIRDCYDADVVVYVHNGESGAGETLDAIYETIESHLATEYDVHRKTSAIRLLNRDSKSYEHVDVVPGRYFDDDKSDTWLHRTTGDKKRFKTNLDVHLDTIRESGLVPLIRLTKLWAVRNSITCPTFILELLCIEVCSNVKTSKLADQVEHLFTEFRDNVEGLSVEDPANPTGNDLSEPLDAIRPLLQAFGEQALASIEDEDWVSVFGDLPIEASEATERLRSVAVVTRPATEPWSQWP